MSLIPLTLSLPLSRPLGFAHLCRGFPARSIRSIGTRSLPTLTRSYPRRFTFYVADPISSIETRSLPTLTRSYPRRFAFYVADPISSIRSERFLRFFPRPHDRELAYIIGECLPGPGD